MKKTIAMMQAALLLLMAVSMPVMAVQSRTPWTMANISFVGTTATCGVHVDGDDSNDRIEAYMELWDGDSFVASWEATSTGHLEWSEKVSVSRGKTYTLEAFVVINGSTISTDYATGICP